MITPIWLPAFVASLSAAPYEQKFHITMNPVLLAQTVNRQLKPMFTLFRCVYQVTTVSLGYCKLVAADTQDAKSTATKVKIVVQEVMCDCKRDQIVD